MDLHDGSLSRGIRCPLDICRWDPLLSGNERDRRRRRRYPLGDEGVLAARQRVIEHWRWRPPRSQRRGSPGCLGGVGEAFSVWSSWGTRERSKWPRNVLCARRMGIHPILHARAADITGGRQVFERAVFLSCGATSHQRRGFRDPRSCSRTTGEIPVSERRRPAPRGPGRHRRAPVPGLGDERHI